MSLKVWEAMEAAGELTGGKFTASDLRRTVETRLSAEGVSAEVRAHLQSHGLGGVQARHYDRHSYLPEKRAALETLPAILAPQLATLNDDHAIRQLLEEHIGAALNELCDRLAGLDGAAK